MSYTACLELAQARLQVSLLLGGDLVSLLSHYHPRIRRGKPTSSICFPGLSSHLQGQSSRRAFVPFHLACGRSVSPGESTAGILSGFPGWEMDAD